MTQYQSTECGFRIEVWSTMIKPITAFIPTNSSPHSYSNKTWWAQVNVEFIILFIFVAPTVWSASAFSSVGGELIKFLQGTKPSSPLPKEEVG